MGNTKQPCARLQPQELVVRNLSLHRRFHHLWRVGAFITSATLHSLCTRASAVWEAISSTYKLPRHSHRSFLTRSFSLWSDRFLSVRALPFTFRKAEEAIIPGFLRNVGNPGFTISQILCFLPCFWFFEAFLGWKCRFIATLPWLRVFAAYWKCFQTLKPFHFYFFHFFCLCETIFQLCFEKEPIKKKYILKFCFECFLCVWKCLSFIYTYISVVWRLKFLLENCFWLRLCLAPGKFDENARGKKIQRKSRRKINSVLKILKLFLFAISNSIYL